MEQVYRAKLNVLQAVFLLLQVRPEIDNNLSEVALKLGDTLLRTYFTEKFDVSI